jgi:hypothetical protein
MNNWIFVFFISAVTILVLILLFLIAEKVGRYFSPNRDVGIWERGEDDEMDWRRNQTGDAGENNEVNISKLKILL